MSMSLTRRDALKGIAAATVLPLVPAWAFPPPETVEMLQSAISMMGGFFFEQTPQVPRSLDSTPQPGARLTFPTIGQSKTFPRNQQLAAWMPSGKTAIALKQPDPSAG